MHVRTSKVSGFSLLTVHHDLCPSCSQASLHVKRLAPNTFVDVAVRALVSSGVVPWKTTPSKISASR